MAFGSTVKTPTPPKKVLNIDADQVNTNQQAIPVPYLAGRQRVGLKFFTPVYDQINEPVKTETGKGESTTTGYIYYGSLAGLICMGGRVRVTKLFKHIIDSEIAWRNDTGLAAGAAPSEPVSIDGYGSTWIYWGGPNQPVDPNVLTPIGPTPTNPGFNPRDESTWPGNNYPTEHPN